MSKFGIGNHCPLESPQVKFQR